MIHTPVCDLLGITVPVVAAPFGPWEQVDLAAAVSRAGGLGSLGTVLRSPDDLRDQWRRNPAELPAAVQLHENLLRKEKVIQVALPTS